MVAYLRAAFAAARPVIAGMVLIVRPVCRSVYLSTGQDIVFIRFIIAAFTHAYTGDEKAHRMLLRKHRGHPKQQQQTYP